jgi:thioredoxin reductase
MMASRFGVAVIGGGPAGLAAAISASESGTSVILVERELRLGGILKQCIHDGFGVVRYEEKLSGPEYAFRDIAALDQTNTVVMLQTFVTRIERMGSSFLLTLSNRHGIVQVEAGSIVLATGCRERTSKQIAIHGMRPAGILTAGSAQYYTNILGQLPAKRCIILGSGDIGMIMARRLKLEGANVLGVFEAKDSPGGLLRNISQCLNDFDIPLHLSHTVTRVFGSHRLKAVELCRVDKDMIPIRGTENLVECDSLILSVGLIPENELAESLGAELCKKTRGPLCDQNYMTTVDGVFSCGNAMHVNDLVDYVSESGEVAGRRAAHYTEHPRTLIKINVSKDFLYSVPQFLDFETMRNETVLFFRSSEARKNTLVRVLADDQEVFSEQYEHLRPPEMERITVDFGQGLAPDSKISIVMEKKL